MKDEFLAVLSHELGSPLNPILGWSKLLLNNKLDAAKIALALATIQRNAKLQSELIEDLLDVSRILQSKLNLNASPVNLASILKRRSANQDERSPEQSLDLNGIKILVVDDETDTRELVAFLVELPSDNMSGK